MSTKTSTQIKAALKQLKTDYLKTARAEFKAGFASLFELYPQLKSISWPQYTPYFNDGDECTFSVHNEEPTINGYSEWGNEGDENGPNLFKLAEGGDAQAKQCIKAVENLLGAFDEDIYKDLFDDHVEVTITAKGITTSEYQHD